MNRFDKFTVELLQLAKVAGDYVPVQVHTLAYKYGMDQRHVREKLLQLHDDKLVELSAYDEQAARVVSLNEWTRGREHFLLYASDGNNKRVTLLVKGAEFLESLAMSKQNSPVDAAIDHLNLLLSKFEEVRHASGQTPEFVGWRDLTLAALERYLGSTNPSFKTFQGLGFRDRVQVVPFSRTAHNAHNMSQFRMQESSLPQENADRFRRNCEIAEQTIKAAIEHIRHFGLHPLQSGSNEHQSGGVRQNFYGEVNMGPQAFALDNATQSVGQMGGNDVAVLDGLLTLFKTSMDLTPRQIQEAELAATEITKEAAKPAAEQNRKSILEYSEKLLGIADKAVDLGHKLVPYAVYLQALMKHCF